MRFSLLLLTGMVAVTTALPQRPGGGRGRLRGGQGFGQNAQGSGAGVPGTDLPVFTNPQGGEQPPAVVPDNAQAGVGQGIADEGNLNDQGNLAPNGQGSLDNGSQANQGGANNQGVPGDQSIPGDQGAGNANQNGNDIGGSGQNQNGQNGQNQTGQDQGQNGANQPTGAFDPSLVPEFGVQAGVSPDGQGNCIGLNNVKIPCSCPPDRQDFIQRVQAAAASGNSEGVPVEFPLDDSSASKKARIQTSIVVLQNLNGRGVGCPAAATTFLAQQAAA